MASKDGKAIELYPLGGVDQRWRTDPKKAARVTDMEWSDYGGWRNGPGFRSITESYYDDGQTQDLDPWASGAGEGGQIISLHWFAQHNGAKQWMIWETEDGDLRAFSGPDAHASTSLPWRNLRDIEGRAFDGSTRLRTWIKTPTAGTWSVPWGDRLYLMNGIDEPLMFDGWKVQRAGYQTAPAPPAGLVIDTTTTLDSIGMGNKADQAGVEGTDDVTCGYKLLATFMNEYGAESPPSAASSMAAFANPAGQSGTSPRHGISWSIPTGPPGTVARLLYRTRNIADSDGNFDNLGRGKNFYFLRKLDDNTTTLYEDWAPDAQLSSLLDERDLGGWPAGAKYGAVFKNIHFIAGMPNNRVRFSGAASPEVFPLDNEFRVGDQSGGPITGLYATRNALFVFKMRSVHMIKGDPSNGFFIQPLSMEAGCAAPKTIKEVPGLGLVFVGEDGIYLMQGALEGGEQVTKPVRVSTPVPDLWERVNKSALLNARADVWLRKRELWIALPVLGADTNSLVLKFSYEVGEWSWSDLWPIADLVAPRDHRGYLYFGSHNTAYPGIQIVTHAASTKGAGGSAVTPLYETSPFDFGQLYRGLHLGYVNVHAVGYGDNDLECNIRVNRSLSNVYTTADSADQQHLDDRFDVYGTATWGSETWAKRRPIVIRYDVTHMGSTLANEVQVTLTPADQRVELIAIHMEADAFAHRPLSSRHGPASR